MCIRDSGYYDQKPIAELMGTMGEEIGPEFVLATEIYTLSLHDALPI